MEGLVADEYVTFDDAGGAFQLTTRPARFWRTGVLATDYSRAVAGATRARARDPTAPRRRHAFDSVVMRAESRNSPVTRRCCLGSSRTFPEEVFWRSLRSAAGPSRGRRRAPGP